VALKYSFFNRYNILNQGNIPKNQSKKGSITIQAILKLLNCPTIKKYIASRAKIIAVHKSLNVSIVSFHSPSHSILYVFQSFNHSKVKS
jgi:hypothetical protein